MNKYLFLDIDGVLNSYRTLFAFGKYGLSTNIKKQVLLGMPTDSFFDPIAVLLLKEAQEKIGFKIVISSSWRRTLGVKDFIIMFNEYGWDTNDIIIGKTGTENCIRGQQIKNWLQQNASEPYKFVILDDESDFLPEQNNNLVKTSYSEGFCYNNYKKIFEIFGETCYDTLP